MTDFTMTPPDALKMLLMGKQGYDQGKERYVDLARSQASQDLQTNPQSAIARLLQAGDIQGASTVASMGNNARDFQFRQQEAQRAQGNADRTFGLQREQLIPKPSIQKLKDANGNEQLVRVGPDGTSTPIDVTNSGGAPTNPFAYGKMNETQSKDAGYANRLFRAEQVLRDPKVEDAATSLTQVGMDKIPIAGNYLTSPDFQRFDQAQRDFVNAVLRRESGAAISQSEFDNAKKQYFPQPGDSKERLVEKRKNRQDTLAAIAGGGGQSYKPPFTFGPDGALMPTGNSGQGVTQPKPAAPPIPGAKQAPDGNFYVPDPARPGKYLKVN